ncbi:MAG TPA: alpha/beta hydrolase, partial [Dehalococcoidia bacterium]|nr:alpha/beta hydrolase [Dehalococcoidia bacterium]
VRRFLELPGRRISYLEWPGPDPVILCLHGLAFNAWLWGPFGRAWAGRHRVIALDIRGHGESDHPPTGYAYSEIGDDILRAMGAFCATPPLVVGHSMGGRVSLWLAANHGAVYDRLVVVDSRMGKTPPRNLDRHPAERVFPDWDAYIASAKRAKFHRNWTPDMERFVALHAKTQPDGTVQMRFTPQSFDQISGTSRAYDLIADLDRVTCPTLFVRATEGNLSEETLERIREKMPHIETAVIEGANHCVPLDKPDEFIAVTRPFLSAPRETLRSRDAVVWG